MMPIYEYHCPKCGEFEVIQKISDKPLSSCPTCRRKVNKLISSTSFQLKGSGWYITDYARKGGTGESSGKTAKADDKGTKAEDKKSDTSASDSTKSESTKSDTKSDSSSSKKAGSTKAAAA
jgi:putative FmdB family regulatory protein